MISLGAFLAVAAALFALGLAGLCARRSFLHALLALQLAFAGAALACAAFARFHGAAPGGRDFALLVAVLAGVEALAGLAFVAVRARARADAASASELERRD